VISIELLGETSPQVTALCRLAHHKRPANETDTKNVEMLEWQRLATSLALSVPGRPGDLLEDYQATTPGQAWQVRRRIHGSLPVPSTWRSAAGAQRGDAQHLLMSRDASWSGATAATAARTATVVVGGVRGER
jgi:hypothetical protein